MLENDFLKKDFRYRVKFTNKCIAIIRFSKDEKRVKSFKNLLFKMMKGVILKNICNYLNLLQNICREDIIPERDELIADCYVIFDKCLEKYIISKKYNFYFYFNKSLSRSFFRDYQKKFQRSNSVEITEAIETIHNGLFVNKEPDTTEILMEQINFNDIEKRICRSRMLGQKNSDFLEKNSDITSAQYSKALKHIKEILTIQKERGEI